MTREDFEEAIRQLLEEKGCSRIRISTSLLGMKAEVRCRDAKGRRRELIARPEKKHGRSVVKLEPASGTEWIDELEMLEALLD